MKYVFIDESDTVMLADGTKTNRTFIVHAEIYPTAVRKLNEFLRKNFQNYKSMKIKFIGASDYNVD